MDQGINLTIERYLKLVRSQYNDVERVFVFGSYAKQRSTPESDIDIALIFSNLADDEIFDTQVQLMILASQIDTRIEPHPFSQNDFESGNPFAIEIQKSGIEIL